MHEPRASRPRRLVTWLPAAMVAGAWFVVGAWWTHGFTAFTAFSAAVAAAGPLPRSAPRFEVIDQGGRTIDLGARDGGYRLVQAMYKRNRLHLALTLKSGANVLLLDEPTNDIDVNTLRALEEGLENFAGCAVIISHDRWFLDRVATHILAFEGDSKVVWFEGSFSEYDENYRKRTGNAGPVRFRYKKLS